MKIVRLAFFDKKISFLFSTIHRNLCQNKKKILRKFNDTILAKCMKFVWLVFFIDLVYGIVRLTFLVYGVNPSIQKRFLKF